MSDPIFYTAEKISAAVRALAIGRGRVRERLVSACNAGLYGMNPAAFRDADARRMAERVKESLFGQERTVDVAVEGMDEDQAVSIAADLVSLESRASSQIEALIDRRRDD